MEDHDRVRLNTSRDVQAELDREMANSVHRFEAAASEDISMRMDELDGEWGMERMPRTPEGTLQAVWT